MQPYWPPRAKVTPGLTSDEAFTLSAIGHTEADAAGRFRLDAPRTSSARQEEVMLTALAPGFGVGWARFDPDAEEPAADIALAAEQIIEGRLVDMQGRPAQGVVLFIPAITRDLVSESGPFVLVVSALRVRGFRGFDPMICQAGRHQRPQDQTGASPSTASGGAFIPRCL